MIFLPSLHTHPLFFLLFLSPFSFSFFFSLHSLYLFISPNTFFSSALFGSKLPFFFTHCFFFFPQSFSLLLFTYFPYLILILLLTLYLTTFYTSALFGSNLPAFMVSLFPEKNRYSGIGIGKSIDK